MKYLQLLIFAVFSCCIHAQYYSDSIREIREKAENDYKKGILNEEELQSFSGICYFPVDSSYRITAELIHAPGKKFKMPMTKKRDEPVYYKKWGVVRFVLHDTLCELAVYENFDLKHSKEYKNYLFLPFRDGTSGHNSYGGGRFLDLEKNDSGKIVIDFNLAYHPYCLYSKRYSCPVPPAENTLAIHIFAGECYRGEGH